MEHEQKILVAVSSWTWTSSPMTGSYFSRAGAATWGWLAILTDYKAGGCKDCGRHLLSQRDFEIHQLSALCIIDAGQIEA